MRRVKPKGGTFFLENAKKGILGGFMHRPGWFDSALQHQPLPQARGVPGPLRRIKYEDDELYEKLSQKHPELWDNTIVNMVADERGRRSFSFLFFFFFSFFS